MLQRSGDIWQRYPKWALKLLIISGWIKSTLQKKLSLYSWLGDSRATTALLLISSCFLWLRLSLCPFVCRLTGFQLPSPIVSTGSMLTLWLLSDYAVSGQGFKVNYEGKKYIYILHFISPQMWIFEIRTPKRAVVSQTSESLNHIKALLIYFPHNSSHTGYLRQ